VTLAPGTAKLLTLDSASPRDRGVRLQRTARRMRASMRAAGNREPPCATLEMADGLRAPLSMRVQHVFGENARVEQAVGALERRDLPELADFSTPRTRACAIATRSRRRPSKRRWRASSAPARPARGSSAVGSAATCSDSCRRGAAHRGAVVVTPGGGAAAGLAAPPHDLLERRIQRAELLASLAYTSTHSGTGSTRRRARRSRRPRRGRQATRRPRRRRGALTEGRAVVDGHALQRNSSAEATIRSHSSPRALRLTLAQAGCPPSSATSQANRAGRRRRPRALL